MVWIKIKSRTGTTKIACGFKRLPIDFALKKFYTAIVGTWFLIVFIAGV